MRRYSRQNGDGTNPTCTRKRRFFSMAIPMKTRYRIIFKGSPLARWVCTQISRYSHRNATIESDGALCVSAPVRYTNTETREHCPFHVLCQRNAPNRRPYRPKAIYVRGKEVHEKLLFIAMVVKTGRTEEWRSQARNVFMYGFPR